jgi:hypothetical protein
MSVTHVPLVLIGLTMLVALSACGGGGGGGSSTPPPQAPVTPPPPDSEPDAFTIAAISDAPRGTAVASQAVTIQGINMPANVSVAGGEYSVNGGAFTSAAGTVSNAQSIVVRVTAATTPGGVVDATLTVGSVAARFTVTTSTDVTAPTATVVFPTARSRTSSPELIVRGTASDSASPVTSVRVNGVEATSTDNFVTWTATVPLAAGANTIVVDAMDRALNRSAAMPSGNNVVRNALIGFVESLAVDAAQNRVIATDSFAGALLSIDLTSGLRTVIANATTPSTSLAPNRLVTPGSLVLAADGTHAFVLDRNPAPAILRVNLSTGARTLVSGRGFPNSQNDFSTTGVLAMSVDVANGRAYVLNRAPGADAILRVDLATGTRTVLSNATTPDAVNMFPNPNTLGLDLARNQLLVGDIGLGMPSTNHAIYAVNLDTGQRTVLSSDTVPNANNPLTYIGGFAIDGARALVLQPDSLAVYAVNLVANQFTPLGDRTVYSSPATSAANPFEQPRAIAVTSMHAYVADAGTRSLLRVDLPTGIREAVVSPNEPADIGARQRYSTGVAVDLSANRLYVVDPLSSAVNGVNLSTGDRTLLSSTTTPPGPAWSYPNAVTIDKPNNRLFVVDLYGPAVYQVGLGTGTRQVISAASQSGIAFGSPQILAIDAANNRALVTDFNLAAVVAVNLSDGGRTILSGPGVPNGDNALVLPHGIAIDAAGNRALVTNGNPPSVVAVDLATGSRSVLSPAGSPGTWAPASVAIDAATRLIVTGDTSFGAVHVIDAVSGNRTLVSNATTPRMNDALKPRGMAVDASRRIAWVSNDLFAIPQVVDLVTGERVFLTR